MKRYILLAEIEREQITNGYSDNQSLYDQQKLAEQNRQLDLTRQYNAENASLSAKLEGIGATWENTYLATSIDYLKNDVPFLMADSDDYMTNMTDEAMLELEQLSGISPKYHQRLMSAKNEEQLAYYIKESLEDQEKQKRVSETLNSYGGIFTEATMASLTTGLLGDIDAPLMVASGGIYSAAKAGIVTARLGALKKTMQGGAITTHVGASAIAYEKDPNVSSTEAVIFAGLGSVIDTIAIGKMSPSVKTKADIERGINELNVKSLSDDELDNMIFERTQPDFRPYTQTYKDDLMKQGAKADDIQPIKTKGKDGKPAKGEDVKPAKGEDAWTSMFRETVPTKTKADLEWELKSMKREAADIKNYFNEFKQFVKNTADEIKANPTNMNAIKKMENVVQSLKKLYDNGFINKSEFDQLDYAMRNGTPEKINNLKVTFKKNKDGTYSPTGKGTNKKKSKGKVMIAGGIVLGTTGAYADGDDIISDGISLLFAAAVLGAAWANKGAILKALSNGMSKIRNKETISSVDEAIDSARISLMETLAPILKDPNKDVRELAKDLFWDSFDGTKNTVETIATNTFNSVFKVYEKNIDKLYEGWAKENGINILQRAASNLRHAASERQLFDIEVMKTVETGKPHASKSVNEASKLTIDANKRILDIMQEVGMVGAEGIKFDPRYMHRAYRPQFGQLLSLLKNADGYKQSYDKFVQSFAKMMDDGNIAPDKLLKKAQNYVRLLSENGVSKNTFKSIDELDDYLKKNGMGEMDALEVADFLGITKGMDKITASERLGATKRRVWLNKNAFEEFEIDTPDGRMTIGLDNIFVNQATEVMLTHIKQASGYIAFAKKGIDINQAYKTADKSVSHGKAISAYIDNVLGLPVLDGSTQTMKLVRDMANYTTALRLPLSALTLTGELFKMTASMNKNGLLMGVRQLVKAILREGDTELAKNLREGMGIGIHRNGLNFGAYSHLDMDNLADADYRSSIIGKSVTNIGQVTSDLILYPMVSISDWLTVMSMAKNAQILRNFVDGKIGMADFRVKAYGINASDKATIKKYIKLNDKGEVKPIDWDSMSFDERTNIQRILFNMTQKDVMITTSGGTGSWGRTSEVGMAVAHLTKFPQQAFANHGLFNIKGMSQGEVKSFVETSMWFIGAMVTNELKASVKGQELSDEDLIARSAMMMPIAGMIGVAESISNPAIVGVTQNLAVVSELVYD